MSSRTSSGISFLIVSFLNERLQIRRRDCVAGAAEVADNVQVLVLAAQFLQVLERERGKRGEHAVLAARAERLRVYFAHDFDIVRSAELVQEFVEVESLVCLVHVVELRQVLHDDFDEVDVLLFEVGESFDVETGSIVQLARVLHVELSLDAHRRTDLFGLEQIHREVLAHRHGRRLDDAFVDALAELVQLHDAYVLRDEGGFVCPDGLEFCLRNHRTDKTHRRRIGLNFRDFATERGGERDCPGKLQPCTEEYACNGVFGKQLESKSLGVMMAANFVHGRCQIGHDKAKWRFFARRADDSVFEIHATKFSKKRSRGNCCPYFSEEKCYEKGWKMQILL